MSSPWQWLLLTLELYPPVKFIWLNWQYIHGWQIVNMYAAQIEYYISMWQKFTSSYKWVNEHAYSVAMHLICKKQTNFKLSLHSNWESVLLCKGCTLNLEGLSSCLRTQWKSSVSHLLHFLWQDLGRLFWPCWKFVRGQHVDIVTLTVRWFMPFICGANI